MYLKIKEIAAKYGMKATYVNNHFQYGKEHHKFFVEGINCKRGRRDIKNLGEGPHYNGEVNKEPWLIDEHAFLEYVKQRKEEGREIYDKVMDKVKSAGKKNRREYLQTLKEGWAEVTGGEKRPDRLYWFAKPRLKEIRQGVCMAECIAQELGINIQFYKTVENGHRSMKRKTVEEIAKYLGVDVKEIFEERPW